MKLGGIRDGVRRLFRLDVRTPERIRAEANEELYSLIDARIEHLVARGMTPDEARTETERRLGGTIDDVRVALEQSAIQREERMQFSERFDWIRQDIGVALRGLRGAPGFTATVVLTLALGVGANAAVFSVLEQIYLREPAGLTNSSELRRVYERLPADAPMNGSHKLAVIDQFDYSTYAAVRDGLSGNGDLAAYSPSDSQSIGHGESAIPARVSFVTANYFSLLGVRAARGRFFAPNEAVVETNPGVAVISNALWARAFGRDSTIIGRTIEVHKQPYVVIGVAGSGFSGVDLNQAELFLPLGAFSAAPMNGKPWYKVSIATYFRMVARVAGGDDRRLVATATVINRRLSADMKGQLLPGTQPDTSSTIVTGPIITALGPATNPKEYAVGLRLAGVATIVLLIACANVTNLLLVRAIRRRHEVAVRLALGVSRARLIGQFLIEGGALAAISSVAAIVIAAWGSGALRRIILPTTHWSAPTLNAGVLGFTLALAILAGVAAALLPALHGSRTEIVKSLKPGSRGHEPARSRVRSGLLVAQTALSLVLLVGAGLFVQSLRKLRDLPIGYAADQLAFASVRFDGFAKHREERIDAFPRAAERIATAPGVVGVAVADHAPMLGGNTMPLFVPNADTAVGALFNSVSPKFFDVAGVRILRGRALSDDDRRDPGGAVVVDETMAKAFWPGESPIGKCLMLREKSAPCSTVVGVAADVHMMSILETKTWPQYFLPMRSAIDSLTVAPGAIIVRTAAGQWGAADAIARSELRRLIPSAASVTFNPMTKYLEPELRPWKLGATLFTAFGLLALLVAAVGVYGVIAYSFSQRTHELGVRTALGASVRDTYELVLGEALRLTAIGVVAGVLLALALGRLIASLLYATSARDPLVITAAAFVLLVVGIAASLVPAWRAGKSDPMTALRSD